MALVYASGKTSEWALQLNPAKVASDFFASFLPRDASAERGDATVSRLSVCLSVCP